MTILSAQSIIGRVVGLSLLSTDSSWWALGIDPWEPNSKQALGMSYGLTAAGYDIRVGEVDIERIRGSKTESLLLRPGGFSLVASLERIRVPNDLQVIVHDKSSWARQGLAIQNTVLEPGWEGYITLELSNHGNEFLHIKRGQPIAQLVFHQLDQPTDRPYRGKYQNQGPEPTEAIASFDTVAELMEDLNDGDESGTATSTSSFKGFGIEDGPLTPTDLG